MKNWRPLRPQCVEELLRRDGCADAPTDICSAKGCSQRSPRFRCQSCHGDLLFCQTCCVMMHEYNPLHLIDCWDGVCFTGTTLKELGLRIQFGHPGCVRPKPASEGFVVLHLNGIQEVNVNYCGCDVAASHGTPYVQLLRRGWYPATPITPGTAATFELLDFFHAQTLQAKTTMYDFYVALEKLTNNTGIKPSTRYPEFLRMTRQHRHLLMLKRAGRAHDPSGIFGTQPGECAVLCPACPRPGVNLPNDWENAAPEQRFLYVLFLALDACFRLKRRLISSERRDPGLGTGWAYFTESEPYRQYLLSVTDQKEISTCSGLAALDYANTKFSRGYSSTGVGMGVCARHEFVQPNGVGDLQKGERYANMDYIFASILRHLDERLRKVISYDIVCQWWKSLKKRLLSLPPLLRLSLALKIMRFVIPKMHINAHILACRLAFSLSFLAGAGQTDGGGFERPWANIGGVATSTREQGPGFRWDTLDDHWNYWNWVKLTILPRLLRRRLDTAKIESAKQVEAFELFSEQQQERIPVWKKMVDDFEVQQELGPDAELKEEDRCKNPYAIEVKGLTEGQVRLQFAAEEAQRAELGVPALHDVSPSSFIYAGLALEEEQRRVRIQAELKKAKTTGQQISLTGIRTKLTRGIQRFRRLQAVYTPAALQAAARAARTAPDASELPEDAPLFMPSSLSADERTTGCAAGLADIEGRARHAQCRASLVRLRNQLHVKSRLLTYKKIHSRHQGPNTRSRTIVTRNESKIRLHSEKYQAAWDALARLNNGVHGWQKLRKRDIRLLEDAEELSKRQRRRERQDARSLERQRRLIEAGELRPPTPPTDGESDHGEDGERAARGGESVREISWIWTVAGTEGTDGDLEGALRIEWAKAYARKRRWQEEVQLLQEEQRRLLVSFEHNAFVWEQRGMALPTGGTEAGFLQGAKAYAAKSARMFREMKKQAEVTFTEPRLANGKKRKVPRAPIPEGIDEERDSEDGDEDEDEDGDESDAAWDGTADADERGAYSDEELFLGGEDEEM
ncbi:hypothetical protein B0H16DRAFT_1339627 [Mycena metata]|uniref:CxC2-like cysteine cluster KDZ transposase-associated domain-containing protein n=1 Tax=Mycena metata TaxID=1033252 RepID=A0AAD7MGT2_9AGAR|nr:hypothetical protein B0H16DRAFT_1339627 [Mycena metata]